MMIEKKDHISVMLDEVLNYLEPKEGGIYVDATFGAGGYSRSLIEKIKPKKLYAIDRDKNALKYAEQLKRDYPENFEFIEGEFSNLKEYMEIKGISEIDGIMFDIGVSSMQIDNPNRGFSFMHDGPLSMKMGETGKDLVQFINEAKEEDIANIIYLYGDEHLSRKIAHKICLKRQEKRIDRTLQLAEIVRSAYGFKAKKLKIDPATKTFQALRIYVNDELTELEQALEQAETLLKPNGRMVVVSFHALEDRIVKNFFLSKADYNQNISRYLPETNRKDHVISLKILTKSSIKPSELEVKNNPRARSAKLRAAMKLNILGDAA